MSERKEGPQFPATPEERAVWGDYQLAQGVMPPWPIKEKPTSISGAEVAARASKLMASLASANAILAGLEEQRAKAEADVVAAESALNRLGVTYFHELSALSRRRTLSVCAEPSCEAIDIHGWRDAEAGWRCREHELPVTPPQDLPAPAPTPEKKGGEKSKTQEAA
jgi:hypothetical protein